MYANRKRKSGKATAILKLLKRLACRRALENFPSVLPAEEKIDKQVGAWYIRGMTTTLFMNGRSQAVRLPKELRLPGKEVSIRRLGDGVLIEPITEMVWPSDYFESIRIDDAQFDRPPQGHTPASPSFTQ